MSKSKIYRRLRLLIIILLNICNFGSSHAFANQKAHIQEKSEGCVEALDIGCLYKTLLAWGLEKYKSGDVGRVHFFYSLSASTLAVGDFELAEAIALRAIAELNENDKFPSKEYSRGLFLLRQIKEKQGQEDESKELYKIATWGQDTTIKEINKLDIKNLIKKYLEINKEFAREKSDWTYLPLNRYQGDYLSAYLAMLENLASLLSEDKQFDTAQDIIGQINKEHVSKIFGPRSRSLVFTDEDQGSLNLINSLANFDMNQALIHKDIIAQQIISPDDETVFVNLLFDFALAKRRQGDEDYAQKSSQLALHIINTNKSLVEPNYPRKTKFEDVPGLILGQLLHDILLRNNYSDQEKILLQTLTKSSRRNNQAAAPLILQAHCASEGVDSAIAFAQFFKGELEVTTALMECLLVNNKTDQLKTLINNFIAIAENYDYGDLRAEARKRAAYYLYKLGDKKGALKLIDIALEDLKNFSYYCTSETYCPSFYPHNDLMELIIEHEDLPALESRLELTGEELSKSAELLAKHEKFSEAITYLTRAIERFELDVKNVRNKFLEDQKKNPRRYDNVEKSIEYNQNYKRSTGNKQIFNSIYNVCFYVAISDNRNFFEDCNQFLQRVKPYWISEEIYKSPIFLFRSEIAEQILHSGRVNLNDAMIPLRLNPSLTKADINNLVVTLNELKNRNYNEMGSIAREVLLLSLTKKRIQMSDLHKEIYEAANALLRMGEFQLSEELLLDIIDSSRFKMITAARIEFDDRRDRALLRLVTALEKNALDEDAQRILSGITRESIRNEAWFQIAKFLLVRGESKKAHQVLSNHISLSNSHHLLVDELNYDPRLEQPDDMIIETIDYIADRLYVLDQLGLSEYSPRYEEFLSKIQKYTNSNIVKAHISLVLEQ